MTISEDGKEEVNFADRFYRALYEVLLKVHSSGSSTKGVSKLDEYFGLVFKALKADKNLERVVAFIRRLLQVSLVNEVNFAAASLLVLNEVLNSRPDVKFQIFGYTSTGKAQKNGNSKISKGLDSDEEENFVDADKLQ